ncbi:Uncharacterised protein [Streptococcus pneumoniae]|nr:Uncharacterised protein [Streptococcus pneumoniae]
MKADVVEEIFRISPKLSLTGIHYKHIHTIKNISNKLEQLPETRKQA